MGTATISLMMEERTPASTAPVGSDVISFIRDEITLVGTTSVGIPEIASTSDESASVGSRLVGTAVMSLIKELTIPLTGRPVAIADISDTSEETTPESSTLDGRAMISLIKELATWVTGKSVAMPEIPLKMEEAAAGFSNSEGRAVISETTGLMISVAGRSVARADARPVIAPIRADTALAGTNEVGKAATSLMMEDSALGSMDPVGKALRSPKSDETMLVGAAKALTAPIKDDKTLETGTTVAAGSVIAVRSSKTEERALAGIRLVGMADRPTAGIPLKMEDTRPGFRTEVGTTVIIDRLRTTEGSPEINEGKLKADKIFDTRAGSMAVAVGKFALIELTKSTGRVAVGSSAVNRAATEDGR